MEDSLPQAKRMIENPPYPTLPQCLVDLVKEKGFQISVDEAIQYIKESRSKKIGQSKKITQKDPVQPIKSQSELTLTIHWNAAGISKHDEVVDLPKAVDSMVMALRCLVEAFGEEIIDKLKTVTVRGLPLILEAKSNTYHQQKPLEFKHYLVVVHSSNPDKVNIFKSVCRCLSLPEHFIEVRINN